MTKTFCRIVLLTVLMSFPALSQEQSSVNSPLSSAQLLDNRFTVGVAVPFHDTRDARFSSTYRTAIGLRLRLEYESDDATKGITNRISANGGIAVENTAEPSFTTMQGGILRYDHFRRFDAISPHLFVGGYADVGAFFATRQKFWIDDGTSLSYTLWGSLGATAEWRQAIELSPTLSATWRTSVSVPLVGYIIRPFFGFPYPSRFLRDGVFNFTQDGLYEQIPASGQVQTVNGFMNAIARTGLELPVSSTTRIGMEYWFQALYAASAPRSYFQITHQITIFAGFRL